MTDAEIASHMNWRGPGAYTKHHMKRIRRIIEEVQREERKAIIEILANNNPRNNGTATTIYSTAGSKEFDDGWLVAIETKLHAIRSRGQA